ncbi:hypothetical protein [Ferruginivarius sediminum]|uniref:Uncharacterized protein n=1 Tax=Ferruginivarius sediminum TaxID=2661937 RepID=A0A369TEQ5_9PROT|nr:hypothetical protein [Ferruginivarius sediminum]RDD63322.1 hypothetical protein DRB17_02410 [Ferruginivarius sediminum]
MKQSDRPGWAHDDPRNDRVYLGILIALMATVAIGAAVAIAGEMFFASTAMKDVGFGAAVVAGVLYFAFRFWGRLRAQRYMQEKRRRELTRGFDDTDDDDDGGNGGGNGGGAR